MNDTEPAEKPLGHSGVGNDGEETDGELDKPICTDFVPCVKTPPEVE